MNPFGKISILNKFVFVSSKTTVRVTAARIGSEKSLELYMELDAL